MKINFTERKLTVSDDLKAYAEKKCEKLSKYFGSEAQASVTFSIERGRHTAEITVQHNEMFFRAQEQTDDMYASIDGAIASIDRQIQKNKTRLEKRLRSGAFDKAFNLAADEEEKMAKEEETFDLIRVKVLDVKPMTTEDAILQMNLLSHEFYFFINSEESGKACVVYKRKSGGYGMLVANR